MTGLADRANEATRVFQEQQAELRAERLERDTTLTTTPKAKGAPGHDQRNERPS